MALSLGSALATKVYLGATEVSLAYLGATQVYTSSAFSAEAQDYFDRLDTAGDTTYVDYKQPLANYIDSLVALGGAYWDDLESAASFVGVGIQGVTVPLKSTMPTLTNNNFVAGDLDPLTGLLSDGSTKYLATGLTGTDLSQNDHSLSVYASSGATTGFLSGIYGTNFTRTISLALASTTTNFYSTAPLDSSSKITSTPSLVGLSRSASTEFTARTNQGDETFTRTSGIPNTGGLSFFAVGAGVAPTAARLATYHAGPALNLATLEGLQETLLSEVAAENYFARLVTAGDTTHTAYKTPITNYFTGLFQNNLWDKLESSALFVGVGIQGVTVPLKSTMTALTNNNFVAGDLNQLTGLKGDASTKYLDTGSKFNDFPQNDFSMSANITEFIQETTDGNYLVYNSFGNGVSQLATQNDAGGSPNNLITRCNTRNGELLIDLGNLEDFYGINRTVSTEYSVQYGASSTTVTETSQAPANQIISILGASTQLKSNARMAT